MPVNLHGCLGPDTIRNITYRDDGGLGPEANFPCFKNRGKDVWRIHSF